MATSDENFCPYRDGDEVHIRELFQRSFGHALSEWVWTWRFRDNAAGPGIIFLAWHGDLLVAHYAVTLTNLWINGCDRLTGLSGTTMTHPDFRGRGLFEKLAHETYAHMLESDMPLVWGFPNAMIHRSRAQQLKWVDIYEVPTFRLSLAKQMSWSSDHVLQMDDFDDRFDSLWEAVKHEYRIIARRDRKHLHWRYVQNPQEHYQILACEEGLGIGGYAIFKRYKTELQIVDILVRNASIGEQLIARIARIGAEESASAISLWLNVVHPLHHTLEKMGFQNGEPVTYLGGLALQDGLAEAGIYDFHNWYLTMGDSDVF